MAESQKRPIQTSPPETLSAHSTAALPSVVVTLSVGWRDIVIGAAALRPRPLPLPPTLLPTAPLPWLARDLSAASAAAFPCFAAFISSGKSDCCLFQHHPPARMIQTVPKLPSDGGWIRRNDIHA
ncbi:hypothetical protein GUJ93_ZPchr0010g8286 [Zizania palustris]|uniref:Uncharacterized protein n=1 Tax=Zizania palustris TaxID=103762 RepID=A0A8J6BQ97_ZIZPA|nr:hypothetical protein GUJ93_ZPchr0010g8286 [Zizania palustris]KAG8087329.1 hypothetical protein GUJ93_ZPchr0010g8286 [Zizania palustris]